MVQLHLVLCMTTDNFNSLADSASLKSELFASFASLLLDMGMPESRLRELFHLAGEEFRKTAWLFHCGRCGFVCTCGNVQKETSRS